ncbi:unnamed protein product [Spirodela intermedia]|uniref:Uncharacterized protein n=1 Tax=Spirodela intermedia TaxID=51605 RepID=A0A7I8I7I3_SPIIN|nr:unnamed protein product [Spirodela intermedia]CAA6653567.1 unnamed protein product [Spirodela intermedia]
MEAAASTPPAPAKKQRDFLLHLEAYLAKRDGVDKLLKISRYATKILLAAPSVREAAELGPRLKAFESSVGVSRKAFRLGKFVQDLNALRTSAVGSRSAADRLLAVVAYGGEGFTTLWSSSLQKISAWAELVGYVGSIALKIEDLKKIRLQLTSIVAANRKSAGFNEGGNEELRRLREKLLLKQLSIVQDLADALMAIGDVRDGKGVLSGPLLMASAGLLSALISTHKNWSSC